MKDELTPAGNIITFETYAAMDDVPAAAWDTVFKGRSCTFSRDFWNVVEKSRMNDFDYRHAIFSDEQGAAVAGITYYTITTDIAIFAPAPLRRLLDGVRRVFPNFMKLRMIECGTPVTINSPPFATKGATPQRIAVAVSKLLRKEARRNRCLLIVVRDFERNAVTEEDDFKLLGYHLVDGLPNTYMDIRWKTPEEYLNSMKSYYRSKLVKHLKRAEEQGFRHALVEDFAAEAETLRNQWMVVHENAKEFQREVLTPDFYRNLSTCMGSRSRAIYVYQQDKLIAHALILMDGDMLRWLYFGRTEAANDSLYIYVAHKVVETAIILGAKRLELGLTTYPIKQDLGAEMEPTKLALRGAPAIINPVVGFFYKLLNSVPESGTRDIFKKD